MGRIKVYTTVLDHADQQEYYETALIPEIKPIEMNVVNVYMDKKYQKIEGFGGALTEAAGYALSQMDNKYQKEILEAYYGKNGIGYTLGRVSMDSCDFALGNYCADDDPLDEKFTKFSLERDQKYVEPILKKINEIAQQQVQLLLSPWSPPAYMKTTKVRNGGGKLRKEYYQRYADYIAKYITEYHNRGFLITQMTIQNEPFAVQLWDSCEYSPMEEKDFLQNYLFPTLKEKGLEHIKIYIWDHNKERVYERTRELMDKDTAKMITGVAYHWYSGDHFDTLRMVREDFPSLLLMHSEGCMEHSRPEEVGDIDVNHAKSYIRDMINDFNNGMNSWIDWNIVLDEKGGPNFVENYCDAPVICDAQNGKVIYKPMFYAISQLSRYIMPGAERIGNSKYTDKIEVSSFLNPDGKVIIVILNSGKEEMIELRMNKMHARIVLKSQSVATAVIDKI